MLDRLGICLNSVNRAGCCGAVNYHLAAHADGLDDMRRNIDAWWPAIEADVEAIVSTASGCGAMLVEYGDLLARDHHYASKAKRVSELTRDIGEILERENLETLGVNSNVDALPGWDDTGGIRSRGFHCAIGGFSAETQNQSHPLPRRP